eukprot:6686327-Lingulodinium_polyedra.AAC.1
MEACGSGCAFPAMYPSRALPTHGHVLRLAARFSRPVPLQGHACRLQGLACQIKAMSTCKPAEEWLALHTSNCEQALTITWHGSFIHL